MPGPSPIFPSKNADGGVGIDMVHLFIHGHAQRGNNIDAATLIEIQDCPSVYKLSSFLCRGHWYKDFCVYGLRKQQQAF